MKNTQLLLLSLCLAGSAGLASAQPGEPGDGPPPNESPRPERHERRHEMGRDHRRGGPGGEADLNHDGYVSADEFAAYQRVEFLKADRNNDGKLDREEVLSIDGHGGIPRAPGPDFRSHNRGEGEFRNPEQIFSNFDTNDDGRLDKTEIPDGMAPLFDRLDADGDGAITVEEFKKGRPERSQDGEHMRERMEQMMKRADANGDGKLQKDEMPPRLQEHFDELDADHDGGVTQEEFKAFREKHESEFGPAFRRHGKGEPRPEGAPGEAAGPMNRSEGPDAAQAPDQPNP